MTYSKADLVDLAKYLASFGKTYGILQDFFEEMTRSVSAFDSEPSDETITKYAFGELRGLFPDVLYALKMPEEDLPMYLDQKIGQEYPIACWRLKRVGLKQ